MLSLVAAVVLEAKAQRVVLAAAAQVDSEREPDLVLRLEQIIQLPLEPVETAAQHQLLETEVLATIRCFQQLPQQAAVLAAEPVPAVALAVLVGVVALK